MFLTKRVEDEMKEFRGLKFGNRNLRIFERMFDESHEFLTKKDKYLWRVEKFSITSKEENLLLPSFKNRCNFTFPTLENVTKRVLQN